MIEPLVRSRYSPDLSTALTLVRRQRGKEARREGGKEGTCGGRKKRWRMGPSLKKKSLLSNVPMTKSGLTHFQTGLHENGGGPPYVLQSVQHVCPT